MVHPPDDASDPKLAGSIAWFLDGPGEPPIDATLGLLLGGPVPTTPGDYVASSVHFEDADSVASALRRAELGPRATAHVHRIVRPDGSCRFVRLEIRAATHLGRPALVGTLTELTPPRERVGGRRAPDAQQTLERAHRAAHRLGSSFLVLLAELEALAAEVEGPQRARVADCIETTERALCFLEPLADCGTSPAPPSLAWHGSAAGDPVAPQSPQTQTRTAPSDCHEHVSTHRAHLAARAVTPMKR